MKKLLTCYSRQACAIMEIYDYLKQGGQNISLGGQKLKRNGGSQAKSKHIS